MHRVMMGLARFWAIMGGFVLTGLVLLICVSVAGRALNGFLHGDVMTSVAPGLAKWLLDLGIGPVNGDFELVEAGVAFAIFAFLPLCQLTNGHAAVDIFANQFPRWLDRTLRTLTEVLFAAILILISERLFDGMMSKMRFGETTFLIQFPIWWAYAASFAGSVVTALVAVYMAAVRVAEFVTGRDMLPAGEGAEH